MEKTDIEDAFRIIHIHPTDYHLLALTWNDIQLFNVWEVNRPEYFPPRCWELLPVYISTEEKMFWSIDLSNIR